MPLRRLWNSICGRSADSPSVNPIPADTPQDVGESTAPVNDPSRLKSNAPAAKPAKAKVAREDKKLCRRLEALATQSSAKSVLEIGVGDGRRALSVVSTLTHRGHSVPVNYIAIDEFELGGGSLTLRDFHKRLREYPAKAQLVPMPCDAGLDRVARTFGQVDVIIWGCDQPATAEQQTSLLRVCKPDTVVFYQDDGKWCESKSDSLSIGSDRKAA